MLSIDSVEWRPRIPISAKKWSAFVGLSGQHAPESVVAMRRIHWSPSAGRRRQHWKDLNERSTYILDSYPIAVCDNYRISRCKLYQGAAWRGFIASKKRFFYGVRVHILITETGQPVEFFLAPAAMSDTAALSRYDLDVPPGSFLTGDRAYNEYTAEDVLLEADVTLLPLRKKNSLRPLPAYFVYLQHAVRKMVETTGSLVERLLPKSIHAVTAKGFELKVALFVLATSINFLW